jgi:hypothetical protein
MCLVNLNQRTVNYWRSKNNRGGVVRHVELAAKDKPNLKGDMSRGLVDMLRKRSGFSVELLL